MAQSDSYDANLEYRGWEVELNRLRDQALLSWEQEARLLAGLGLRDGMSVLELGSGPCFVTEKLLSLLPHSRIAAVEVNPEMHRRARQHLNQDCLNRLDSVEASILNTGLPGQSYDFAIARLVFQHLSQPIEASREIFRLLKTGGKLAIIDIDAALWGISEPYLPELQRIYEKSTRAQTTRGGNQFIGRRLWRILQASGYTNLRLEAFVYHSDELGIEPFISQMNPDRLLPAVQTGLISPVEFATAHNAYQHFLESPNAYILMIGLIACGEKNCSPHADLKG